LRNQATNISHCYSGSEVAASITHRYTSHHSPGM